jgi:hypothetical protein
MLSGFWSDIVGDPSMLWEDIKCDVNPACLFGSDNISAAVGDVASTAGSAANAAVGGLFGGLSTGTWIVLGVAGAVAVYALTKMK